MYSTYAAMGMNPVTVVSKAGLTAMTVAMAGLKHGYLLQVSRCRDLSC